jgi:pre-60S factor REI1
MVQSAPITSTTAPGKVFESRLELAEHYKSDWHKYNLKRKEAGLPLLEQVEFQARWDAALALRKEKQAMEQKKGGSGMGKDHIKPQNKKKQQLQQQQIKKIKMEDDDDEPQPTQQASSSSSSSLSLDAKAIHGGKAIIKVHPKETAESQENPDINPLQCLFDSHISKTIEDNVEYMHQTYGFFIPDRGTFFGIPYAHT